MVTNGLMIVFLSLSLKDSPENESIVAHWLTSKEKVLSEAVCKGDADSLYGRTHQY